jgi:hypothetical protein
MGMNYEKFIDFSHEKYLRHREPRNHIKRTRFVKRDQLTIN